MSTTRKDKNNAPPVDHSGHRKRLRNRAATEGIETFEPHNLLELLLFYTIPRVDTNETGHRLLERFGSFSAVLDAPVEELMEIHGVGPETAQFLNMLPSLFRVYMREKTVPAKKLTDIDECKPLFYPHFVGRTREVLCMICLQAGNAVSRCIEISSGDGSSVEVDCRRIVLEALHANAAGVVLAHNHPSGKAVGSTADHEATAQIADALNAVDIPLIEHFIFAGNRTTALSTDSRFTQFFGDAYRSTKRARNTLPAEPADQRKNLPKTEKRL